MFFDQCTLLPKKGNWPWSFLKVRTHNGNLFTSSPAGKQSPPIFILCNKGQHFVTFDSLSMPMLSRWLDAPVHSRQIPSLLLLIVPFGKEPPFLWLLLIALYGHDLFTFAAYWYSHRIISPPPPLPLRLKWFPTSSFSTVVSWTRCQMQLTVKVLFLFLQDLCACNSKRRGRVLITWPWIPSWIFWQPPLSIPCGCPSPNPSDKKYSKTTMFSSAYFLSQSRKDKTAMYFTNCGQW